MANKGKELIVQADQQEDPRRRKAIETRLRDVLRRKEGLASDIIHWSNHLVDYVGELHWDLGNQFSLRIDAVHYVERWELLRPRAAQAMVEHVDWRRHRAWRSPKLRVLVDGRLRDRSRTAADLRNALVAKSESAS